MKNLLFIAPPAAGKGTQSDALVEKYGYLHISTGDLLREIDKTTPLGKEIDSLISKGQFVSDELILDLLKEKLITLKSQDKFILDGCPRNINQAEKLDKILDDINIKLDAVIYLEVPYDICLKRAIGRINCPNCKTTYNKFFKKPIKDNICDKCNVELVSRSDDNEETFKARFDTYTNLTEPLLEYYEKQNKLFRIDGINDTFEKIVSVINND